MSRKRHVNTRNLVVCNTFDEFAEKVRQLDFNIEDIVGYVTSVSRVFYWLNVESVWGVLGFNWNTASLEDLENAPYIEEQIEHVEADGTNIDYSQKDAEWKREHAVKKGWGTFNATTMPFTLIPQLPDGYRITQLRSTFNLIESNYIEVQKSDWRNLVDINYLARQGQSIKIDITGANLNSDSKVIIGNTRNEDGPWTSTVYIKGDLKNCTNGVLSYNYYNSWVNEHTIALDDDNVGLNIPLSLKTHSTYYYTGDRQFDVREWLYLNEPSSNSNQGIILLSKSKNYFIDNVFANTLYNASIALQVSPASSRCYYPETYTGGEAIRNPIAQGIEPDTIVIDCSEDGNVNEVKISDVAQYQVFGVYNNTLHVNNPIQYIGTPTSIKAWNPYCLVKNDDDWPEYDQSLIDKFRIDGTWDGKFMYGAYIYLTKPSPYTIDCTNLTHLNLFEDALFFVSDYSNFDTFGGNKHALEVVKLINTDFTVFNIGCRNVGGAREMNAFYYKLPSIKTIIFGDMRQPHYFIPRTSVIEFSFWYNYWYDAVYVEDITVPHFKIRYIDTRNYATANYSMLLECGYGVSQVGTSTGPINLYEFDPEILSGTQESADFLKASNINTFINGSREVIHPLVCVNKSITYTDTSIHILSDFVFIYKSHITFKNYHNWQDITNPLTQFVTKIYPGIQANDTDTTYHITFTQNIYNALQTQYPDVYEDLVTNLNYQVSADSQ